MFFGVSWVSIGPELFDLVRSELVRFGVVCCDFIFFAIIDAFRVILVCELFRNHLV